MKKLVSCILFVLAAIPSFAQSKPGTLSVTPQVGASFSNISQESMGLDSSIPGISPLKIGKVRLGLTAGADLQYQVHAAFGVSLGTHYRQMGCNYDDTDLSQATAGNYTVYKDCHLTLHYLSLPLMGHLYVAKNFSLNAGVQISFLLNNNLHAESSEVTVGRDGSYTYQGSTEILDRENKFIRKTDISIPIGLSYEYENVVVDARYNFGLSRLYKAPLDGNNKNRGFVISAGYKFDLARL